MSRKVKILMLGALAAQFPANYTGLTVDNFDPNLYVVFFSGLGLNR